MATNAASSASTSPISSKTSRLSPVTTHPLLTLNQDDTTDDQGGAEDPNTTDSMDGETQQAILIEHEGRDHLTCDDGSHHGGGSESWRQHDRRKHVHSANQSPHPVPPRAGDPRRPDRQGSAPT